MKKIRGFKKGAASFYIVAISTLILVIIAASFATVIISEVTRTSNDDLSQSAYDSALAGVEDAKIVLHSYQRCKSDSTNNNFQTNIDGVENFTCAQLVDWIEKGVVPSGANSCDVLAHALGRNISYDSSNTEQLGVLVQEGNSNESTNDMAQYYTCVKIATQTDDVLGELNGENPEHSFRIKFAESTDSEGHVTSGDENMQKADLVRLSWHLYNPNNDTTSGLDSSRTGFDYPNLNNQGAFEDKYSTPATISLTMIQTAPSFNLDSFTFSNGNRTDRGTLYFVPTDRLDKASSETAAYKTAYNTMENRNYVNATNGFVKSNDKGVAGNNLPFVVYCNDAGQDYICSVDVEIPKPVDSEYRNPETFVFSVALPYGDPDTQFSLQFFNSADMSHPLKLDGVQISVDSTGRANDLFRRVDTRIEPNAAAYPYPIYGIQALDDTSGDPVISKDFITTCEYNFSDQTGAFCR